MVNKFASTWVLGSRRCGEGEIILKIVTKLLMTVALLASAHAYAMPVNVAFGKPVILNGEYGVVTCCWPPGPVAAASTLTDGVYRPQATQWQDGTVWWDVRNANSASNSIEIDLMGTHRLIGLNAQGDDNDIYHIEYWDLGIAAWVLAWDIPAVGGFGMQTRPNPLDNTEFFSLASPITTNRLRFTASAGDGFYSVAEIQAFIPEPGTLTLFGAGLALLGWRQRKS